VHTEHDQALGDTLGRWDAAVQPRSAACVPPIVCIVILPTMTPSQELLQPETHVASRVQPQRKHQQTNIGRNTQRCQHCHHVSARLELLAVQPILANLEKLLVAFSIVSFRQAASY